MPTRLEKLPRSFRLEHRRDFISGMDWRVMLTGQPVGGYAAMNDEFGGKFFHRHQAERAGRVFVETGLLPFLQTDERIAASSPRREAAIRKEAA